MVFTYKNPEVLLNEIRSNEVHRASDLQMYAFEGNFLDVLNEKVAKNNRWSMLVQNGQMDLTVGEDTLISQIHRVSL